MIHPNPLLSREIRARFRDGRAFSLILLLAAALSLFFAFLYGQVAVSEASTARGALTGRTIFTQLSWLQTLGWLLVSPALTSASIAYERERGWFDSLLLSPLSPRAIVLGKWLSALLFALVLGLVTLPLFALVFLLLGGVTLRQFFLIALLQGACAMCGAAIGIAASAWSPRASTALRTANGIIFIGFCASFYGAVAARELPFIFPFPGLTTNAFWTILGRTNPVLRAVEISNDLPIQHTSVCLAFLLALTLFFLWAATFYARRPLQEAPFIQKKTAKSAAKSASTHGEIPFFTRLRFANPVLDREVRAKFRLRQPPLAVVVVEVILGILVAGFYARTLLWAFFEPMYRELIWWGLCFTGLIVTMMAAALMGSNGVSREREGGTWEGVRLSLLSPGEIVRGKVGASVLTCALFSLPVWPLLLPCVVWSADSTARSLVTRGDVAACVAIWLATAWNYTLIGLWIGRKAPRTSRASGQVLGILTTYLLLSPFVFSNFSPSISNTILGATHPLIALANAGDGRGDLAHSTAIFCAFQLVFGVGVWIAAQGAIAREISSAAGGETLRTS
jgi:ABC-type transport system involved in multi-copper enzyme maturation permease subunit